MNTVLFLFDVIEALQIIFNPWNRGFFSQSPVLGGKAGDNSWNEIVIASGNHVFFLSSVLADYLATLPRSREIGKKCSASMLTS